MQKDGFAFFDLDYTMIPYDTLLLLSNFVIRREPWRIFYLMLFLPIAPLALLKIIGSGRTKRIFLSFLWGMRREKLEHLSREFVDRVVLPALYPALLEELERHKKEGRTTVLNTASPSFYVQYIAERLGFHRFYATPVVVPDRMPLIPSINGENNKRSVKIFSMMEILPEEVALAFAGVRGKPGPDELPRLPIPNSHSYSDSPADFPMLLIAEKCTLVRPSSSQLLACAGEWNWTILTPPWPYSGKISHLVSLLRMVLGLYPLR